MRAPLVPFLGLLLLTACADDEGPPGEPTGTSTSGGGGTSAGGGGTGGSGAGGGETGGGGGAPMLVCDPQSDPPPLPASDWCGRLAPGLAGVRTIPVDLSTAHAGVRFFGPVSEYSDADQALIEALQPDAALEGPDLAAYAAVLPGVLCAATAAPQGLGASSVQMIEGAAVVRPGLGPVEIPAAAGAIVVDLRDLPDAPGLREAIEAAIAPALGQPVARPAARVRRHYGMTDELFDPNNLYTNTIAEISRDPIPATGGADRPLALLTGPTMAPAAAEIAAALRIAGRAWIVGEGLRAEVAEARWQGIGGAGVAFRQEDLLLPDGSRLPDEIPADRRLAEPLCIVRELADLGAPPALGRGETSRPEVKHVDPFGKKQPADLDLGTARASLVVAHAAARTFFPYFGQVDDVIDERLVETLGAVGMEVPVRQDLRNILRRFGNALNDGHTLVRDFGGPKYKSFPVYVEDIDGEAVVRQTLAVGVDAGDTVVSIGGVPAADFYQTELARSSAATDHFRFAVASYEYQRLLDPTEFVLRDPDGQTKTLQFQPQPILDFAAVGFTPTLREAGWLTDLGAPDLYYINLTGEVLYDPVDFEAALTEAESAAGLVLDMRGFPGIDLSEVARRIIPGPWNGAVFRVPVSTGLDEREIDEFSDHFEPLDSPSYGGPVALLVGHATLSAAEHFSLALVDAGRATVVGRRSAGTDGNVTAVQLPGAFALSFTGTDLRHADGQKSPFHGVGIVPDIEVPLTAAAFRDGVDPELEAAVSHLLWNP